MPKLLFTPKTHIIGNNTDTFITSSAKGDNPLCIKCNSVAAFIIGQMHPEHKPRTEIIPLVMEEFGCSKDDAEQAVKTVISTLISAGKEKEDE